MRSGCFRCLAAILLAAGSRPALGQAPAAAPAEYAAPARAPYVAEEVIVTSPYGHVLGATLTLPTDAPRPLPVVVLISGTGAQTRNGSFPGDAYRPFRQLADTLSRRGIAVLRMDDRGIAEGRFALPSALQVAEDVRAALVLLRGRGDIDPARIGLLGHSEGGMVALMVGAADPSISALVLLAAPARPAAVMVREQVAAAVARSTAGRASAERDSVLRAALANVERQLQTEWGRQSGGYDPLVAARGIRSASVLVLQGTTDRQVAPEQAGMLAAAISATGACDVAQKHFSGLNHLFLADPDGDPEKYEDLPSKEMGADVLGTVADWLAVRLVAAGAGMTDEESAARASNQRGCAIQSARHPDR